MKSICKDIKLVQRLYKRQVLLGPWTEIRLAVNKRCFNKWYLQFSSEVVYLSVQVRDLAK